MLRAREALRRSTRSPRRSSRERERGGLSLVLHMPRSPALAGLVALLLLLALRLGHTAQQNAFTIDEPMYVGTGLYLWRTGDYDYERALAYHPPLTFHLASLPLLAFDVPEDATRTPRVGRELLRRGQPAPVPLRTTSRAPFILLSCWGVALCFLWAREAAGAGAGLAAAFLYSFSPSLLANGSLAHSDITFSVLFLQTLYATWRWTQRPGAGRLALAGVSLGLALAAKLTAILLLGMLAGTLAIFALRPPHVREASAPLLKRLALAAGAYAAMLAIAAGVLWLAYGGSFRWVVASEGPLAGVSLPSYLRSFLWIEAANAAGRRFYFLGQFFTSGVPSYFPTAFALKEPIGLIALLVAALLTLRRRRRLGLFLAFPVAVYLGMLVFWLQIPLGYRYALPLVAIACLFVATQLWPPFDRRWRVGLAAALALIALESLWIHPHYLAFFNGLIGGPASGHRYLLDSNLDWGQDVTTLARYLASRDDPPAWLALFATESPATYGVRGRPLRHCEPVRGILAISENVRRGLYAPHNIMKEPQPRCFDWLDAYEPVARPGYSILVYDLRGGSDATRPR